ncbi:MAG: c-type cytochrome [Thiobacillus sp.]|nr:c-type cytochrome [Thiobacillus sp.]
MRYRVVFGMILAGLLGSAYAEDKTEALAITCNNCHGVDGVSVGPNMPSIGGLPESYLKNILLEWKAGTRYSATMGRLVKGYSDEQIAALAAYFSKKPWTPAAQTTDPKLVALGKKVTARCAGCHGETGNAGDGDTPNLNGQWAEYLELEALKYRDDAVAMPNKQMRKAAQKLSEEDVKAVAEFYASQKK